VQRSVFAFCAHNQRGASITVLEVMNLPVSASRTAVVPGISALLIKGSFDASLLRSIGALRKGSAFQFRSNRMRPHRGWVNRTEFGRSNRFDVREYGIAQNFGNPSCDGHSMPNSFEEAATVTLNGVFKSQNGAINCPW
jgi:hypothetical protein